MHFMDVVFDVQLQILQFCSPKDLAVVSRVHSSLRDMAEHVLYSRIDFSPQEGEVVEGGTYRSPWSAAAKKTAPLLSTLASNASKASTVKGFYIQLGGEYNLRPILVELAGVLKKMQNLMDLRILIDTDVDDSEGMISKVISGGYFKLQILYLGPYHHIERIVAGQPQLWFLGLYDSGFDTELIWEKVSRLYQSKHCHSHHASSGPVIFTLDFGLKLSNAHDITIFPVFHRSVDVPQVFRHISVQPKIHDFYYEADGYVVSVSLFGISEDNINLFCEALETMAICARRRLYPMLTPESYETLTIIVHETTIQKPWLSPKFIKSLAQLESVKYLNLYFPNIKDAGLYPMSADLRGRLLKDLGQGEWVRLRTISLQGLLNRLNLDRERNWVPANEHSE